MLVVVAIMGVLSTILIVNQTNFSKSNILNDTAYTVALSVRLMQSFGLSSRGFTSSGTTVSNAGYGVHFGDSTTYYDTFADVSPGLPGSTTNCPGHSQSAGPEARPGNCYYDGAQERVQTYTLRNGYTISKICPSSNGIQFLQSSCFVPGGGNTADIVYERPNIQAVITLNSATIVVKAVEIYIKAPAPLTTTRCVIANQLGEVYVPQTCQ